MLPHSDESESTVVGAVLIHQLIFPEAAQYVDAADFYHPARQSIWAAMVELFRQSRPIDEATVVQQMTTHDTVQRLSAFGGPAYLTELAASAITVANIDYHARVIRKKAERRRAISALTELVAGGYDDTDDDDFFAKLDESLLAIAMRRQDDGGLVPFKVALREAVSNIGMRYERKTDVHGVPWGMRRVDEILCGSREGDLVTIGARPGMGKTAMVQQILLHAAALGHPVALYSLEMSRSSLGERALSSQSGIDGRKLRTGKIDAAEWPRLSRHASELAELPVMIDDRARSIGVIRSRALRWRASLKPDCKTPAIGIDYAQLVESSEDAKKKRSREQEVSEVSRTAKTIAMETKGVVFLLAQLSRECERRNDKRPLLSDLRESGTLEQDSDTVAFIYRDEYYSKDSCKAEDRGVAEVIIGKQRNGPTGTARVGFRPECMRFVDLADNREAPADYHEAYDR